MQPYVNALHVAADVIWVGSIMATGVVLTAKSGDAKTRGEIARDIIRKLAAPAFGIAFACGLLQLGLNPKYYFKTTHFMHAKLPLVLGVVALHHIIGAKAKAMATGKTEDAGKVGAMTIAIGVLAIMAASLVLLPKFKAM